MFGFLRGPCGDRHYRQVYARCCRYLRKHYGFAAAPLLSYEAVFAFQMMREGLGRGGCDAGDPSCCRLRGASRLEGAADEPAGRAANALGLLLASIKLEDDVRDDRSLTARLALAFFRNAIRRSKRCFSEIDRESPQRFDAIVARHVAMEQASRGGSLDEFAASTAEGFGYAFSLLAASHQELCGLRETFQAVGHSLGKAIIAADCAADWRRDLRRGLPNPVRNPRQALVAVDVAQRSLADAGWRWKAAVPDSSVTLRVLQSAIQRLDALRRPGHESSPTATPQPSDYRRAPAGDCDCPVGDCGGDLCVGGGGDGGCGDGGCGPCWCDCCLPDCCPGGNNKRGRKDKTAQKAIRGGGSFVGRHGTAHGPLDPNGVILLNGRTFAARTTGEHLPDGAEVVVVEDNDLGVVVRLAAEA